MKSVMKVFVICLISVLFFCGCESQKPKLRKDEFVPPSGYVSVVQITVNPTLNLYLDNNEMILAVEYVNPDAKTCYGKVEKDLVGSNLTQGVQTVIDALEEDGYLENNKVTIDIVETEKKSEKLDILSSVTQSAQEYLAEKQIEAEVVLTEITQKEMENKIAAEQEEANRIEAEKKNPILSLPLNVEYFIVKPEEEGITLKGIYLTFKEDGRYSYAMVPFLNDPYGEGEFITYEGQIYYVAGGGGGSGSYVLTETQIILSEAYDLVFTMTVEGNLIVSQADPTSDFFVVGDQLIRQ